jgi:hypothetical protein
MVNYTSDIDNNSKRSRAVSLAVSLESISSVNLYLLELMGQLVVANTYDLSHHPDTQLYCDRLCLSRRCTANVSSARIVMSMSLP